MNEYIVRDMEPVLCSPRKRLPAVCILIVSGPPREPDFAATVRLIKLQLRQSEPTQHARYLVSVP